MASAAAHRKEIEAMAQREAAAINRAARQQKRILTEREQLRIFQRRLNEEGGQFLKGLIEEGKIESLRLYLNAMKRLELKARSTKREGK